MDDQLSPNRIQTVTGLLPITQSDICDAHNHCWIEKIDGTTPGSFVLDNEPAIKKELVEYKKAGGTCFVDCQPEGAGRNGNRLKQLSLFSGVSIIACTGFHLGQYYPEDYWLFASEADVITNFFKSELTKYLIENGDPVEPIRAGFIKIACRSRFQENSERLLEGAANACLATHCAIEIHTDKGLDTENISAYFQKQGVEPRQIVFCHMDKRPDYGLHYDLASQGFLLEYDTFFRPKYNPNENVWPLIEKLLGVGMEKHIALATDMAEASMWKNIGGGAGLAGFITIIGNRLLALGVNEKVYSKLMGGNILNALATF